LLKNDIKLNLKTEINNQKKQKGLLVKVIFVCFIVNCLLFTAVSYSQSITWQKTYGSLNLNEGLSIVQLPDGGYLAVGRDRAGQDEKTWLLRLDSFGDTLWTKFVMNDFPIKIIETADNNYVILGAFTTIVKVDLNGNLIWQSGPYDYDKTFISLVELSNGSFAICGRNNSGAISYPYLFRISHNGDSLMEKTYTDSIFDGQFTDIQLSHDNNILMNGNVSDSAFISNKLFLMKTSENGDIIWSKRYDTLRNYQSRRIAVMNDGQIIIAGSFFYAKSDSFGNLQWVKRYRQNIFVDVRSICVTNDNNFIFAGTWDSLGTIDIHVYLLKTDTSGNELWHNSYGFNSSDLGNQVKQTADSGFVIIGTREGFHGGDIYLIKTDKNGFANPPIWIEPISNNTPSSFMLYQNYPNPFNPETNIEFDVTKKAAVNIAIYDIQGKQIENFNYGILNAGSYRVNWNAGSMASGVYFYKLVAGEYTETRKMILLK